MQFKKWLGTVLVVFATLAAAQTPPQPTAGTNTVPLASGGIGLDSQESLKAREKDFNLKLVFTLVEGNYLSDVGVTIKDAAGRILLEHVADGPFFLARLPSGTYSVSARYDGKTQTRKVSVTAGRLRTEYLRWPSNPQTDVVLSPEQGRK